MLVPSILEPGSPYCLSVRANGVNIKHFRVFVDEGGKRFYLSPDVPFGSLEDLISHYQCKSPRICINCSVCVVLQPLYRVALALSIIVTLQYV